MRFELVVRSGTSHDLNDQEKKVRLVRDSGVLVHLYVIDLVSEVSS